MKQGFDPFSTKNLTKSNDDLDKEAIDIGE